MGYGREQLVRHSYSNRTSTKGDCEVNFVISSHFIVINLLKYWLVVAKRTIVLQHMLPRSLELNLEAFTTSIVSGMACRTRNVLGKMGP